MSTVADEDGHVAIFWDYENCSPPSTAPGYDITNNIREIAHRFGSVKQFKAYLEMSEQTSAKAVNLRSELQSCGVSLTDCPHNGRKEVADKMMIVDMLTYAIDTPAPATLVLITGDRDFIYAVSVLRLRKYRVVLVAPSTAHAGLKAQASEVLDWNSDVLGKPSKDSRRASFGTACAGSGFDARRRAQTTSVLMSTTSLSTKSKTESASTLDTENNCDRSATPNKIRDPAPSRTAVADDERVGRSPQKTSQALESDGPGFKNLEPIQGLDVCLKNLQDRSSDGDSLPASSPRPTFVSPAPSEATCSETSKPEMRNDAPPVQPSTAPSVHVSSTCNTIPSSEQATIRPSLVQSSPQREEAEISSHPSLSHPQRVGSTQVDHAIGSPAHMNQMRHAPADPRASQPQLAPKVSPVAGSPTFYPQPPPAADARRSVFAEVISAPSTISHTPPGRANVPNAIIPPMMPSPPDRTPLRANATLFIPNGASSSQPPAPMYMQHSSSIAATPVRPVAQSPTVRPATPSSEGSSMYPPSSSGPTVPHPSNPPVPAHFIPLLRILERFREAKLLHAFQSLVAASLIRSNPDLYTTYGFNDFAEYAASAQKAGIVTLGREAGPAWVALKPAWYGRITGG